MTEQSDVPALQFRWAILHVPDVDAALAFYEQAFSLHRRFADPSGEYGELETGGTALAFAAHGLVERIGAHPGGAREPAGFEIALTAMPDAIETAFSRALAAGCTLIKPLARMPWGQTVGFVRDPNSILIEIRTPTGS